MCVYMCARARLLSKHALYSEKGEERGGGPCKSFMVFPTFIVCGAEPGRCGKMTK